MSSSPRWYVPRRTLLRGGAAAIALPFLEQMLLPRRTARAADSSPLRFLAFSTPNGIYMPRFKPAAEGAGYELTPILKPLETIKGDVMVAGGLHNRIAGEASNLHLAGIAALLTGVLPAATGEVNVGVSADRKIAAAPGTKGTAFASLELGGGEEGVEACDGMPCIYGRTLSWANATTPVAKETDPQAAFKRLFGTAGGPPMSMTPGTPAPDERQKRRASIIDACKTDATALRGKLGKADRDKFDQYINSVRELEMQVSAPGVGGSGNGGSTPAPASCKTPTSPGGSYPTDYPARIKALLDVVALAFQCDLTRVVTFMLADWESAYVFKQLGLTGQHHVDYSHHENSPAKEDALEKIDRWQVEQFVYLASKLKGMAEGDGTVLDHSALVFSSEISDGDTHSYDDLPVLIAGKLGGAINSGRSKRFGNVPIANLWLTLMRSFGLTDGSFGNSTGTLDLKA